MWIFWSYLKQLINTFKVKFYFYSYYIFLDWSIILKKLSLILYLFTLFLKWLQIIIFMEDITFNIKKNNKLTFLVDFNPLIFKFDFFLMWILWQFKITC